MTGFGKARLLPVVPGCERRARSRAFLQLYHRGVAGVAVRMGLFAAVLSLVWHCGRSPAFGLAIRSVLWLEKAGLRQSPASSRSCPAAASCAKPGFFEVGPTTAFVRRSGVAVVCLAVRRSPAFGLAIRTVLWTGKSRASAKPGFFPVVPGCERRARSRAFLKWVRPGRSLAACAASHIQAAVGAGGSFVVWQFEEARLLAWRFGPCCELEKAGLRRQSPTAHQASLVLQSGFGSHIVNTTTFASITDSNVPRMNNSGRSQLTRKSSQVT